MYLHFCVPLYSTRSNDSTVVILTFGYFNFDMRIWNDIFFSSKTRWICAFDRAKCIAAECRLSCTRITHTMNESSLDTQSTAEQKRKRREESIFRFCSAVQRIYALCACAKKSTLCGSTPRSIEGANHLVFKPEHPFIVSSGTYSPTRSHI